MKKIIVLFVLAIVFSCSEQKKKTNIESTTKELTVEEKAKSSFDEPLVAMLDSIFESDQQPRREINEIVTKYGRDSDELKQHWQKIAKNDSINLIKVEKIIKEHGWPGKDVIGNKGNTTLFIVIQHAALEVQEKYLPMIREAVKKGGLKPDSLALLEDRMAMYKGDKQIYGTQIKQDTVSGTFYVYPIRDPDNVDKRRAAVGLDSLKNYVSRWNITWDIDLYKQQLLELEKKP